MRRAVLIVVAAAATLTGSASAGAATIYGGTSGTSNAFVLAADRGVLTVSAVWIDARCDNGTTLGYSGPVEFAAQPPAATREDELVLSPNDIGDDRRFSSTATGTADYGENLGQVRLRMRGLSGRRSARGQLELEVVLVSRATQQPVTTCRSGVVSWRGQSAPRRVYGGITDLGHPIVVELRRRPRAVRNLYIGWTADCQPPGQFGLSDALINFEVSRTGRFGDTFEARFPIEGAAGERTYDYRLRGRVRGSRLTGSFGITVTDRDPDGAVTSTCRRAPHGYTATSTT